MGLLFSTIKQSISGTCDGRFHTGDKVQHFKREMAEQGDPKDKYLYRILGFATDADTLEDLVIYQAEYFPFQVWVRKEADFCAPVDKVKYPNIKQENKFVIIPG